MKIIRNLAFAALGIVVLYGVVHVMAPRRQASQRARVDLEAQAVQPGNAERSVEVGITAVEGLSPQENPVPGMSDVLVESATSESQVNAEEQKEIRADVSIQNATWANQGASAAQNGLQDPTARLALALVGIDPEAERYWYDAINDPRLSAHERQDLIEDLNEDGLFDPRNPTVDDLPVILNRMELIEAVRGDAMDEINADAFDEAYKDLLNLSVKAMGNG